MLLGHGQAGERGEGHYSSRWALCWWFLSAQGSCYSAGGVPGHLAVGFGSHSLSLFADWCILSPVTGGGPWLALLGTWAPVEPSPPHLPSPATCCALASLGLDKAAWGQQWIGFDLWPLGSLSCAPSGRPVPPKLWNTILEIGGLGPGLARGFTCIYSCFIITLG